MMAYFIWFYDILYLSFCLCELQLEHLQEIIFSTLQFLSSFLSKILTTTIEPLYLQLLKKKPFMKFQYSRLQKKL
jgi:hypothetical protein